jgi:hypothetical protein
MAKSFRVDRSLKQVPGENIRLNYVPIKKPLPVESAAGAIMTFAFRRATHEHDGRLDRGEDSRRDDECQGVPNACFWHTFGTGC